MYRVHVRPFAVTRSNNETLTVHLRGKDLSTDRTGRKKSSITKDIGMGASTFSTFLNVCEKI